MLRFLLNLSITPLPAKELNELYATFHYQFMSIDCVPEEDLYRFLSKVLSVSPSSLPKIGIKFRTKFVVCILL